MTAVTIFFGHAETNLISISGTGPRLPEATHMRLEVDETQNPVDAPALRPSYLISDLCGLAIGCCYWCSNLDDLSTVLTRLVWDATGQLLPATRLAVTEIVHSDINFTRLGELGHKLPRAA